MAVATLPSNPILIYDLQPSPGGCPYAQRSKIVLEEKGIPHKVELIDPQNKSQEFLDLFRDITSNPNGRGTVPTIIDGNVKLTESHVVSEYLDTAYPQAGPKLFPTDAGNLAKVRLFVELFTSEVQPSFFKILTADSQETVEAGKEGATKGLKVLDSFLKDHSLSSGDYLLGSDFSYAEAATLPFMKRFIVVLPHFFGIEVLKIVADNKLDRLGKWIKTGLDRPSLKATLATDDELIKSLGKFVKLPGAKK